jgi:hypothetical protein
MRRVGVLVQTEIRGLRFRIFSSTKQNGFVAAEQCFVAPDGNECLTTPKVFNKKSPAANPRGACLFTAPGSFS